jgi:hypothetical protein
MAGNPIKTPGRKAEVAGRCKLPNLSLGGLMPDKSPKKPSAKKTADRSLKEKRQDKKDKRSDSPNFGGLRP